MNGWVTIGTKLDTKQLEKDIRQAESQLKQYEREGEKLSTQKAKLEIDLQEYERAKQQIQETTDKALEHAQTEEQVNNVLEMENMQLQQLKQQYSSQFAQIEEINQKLKENENNQQAITTSLGQQKQKLAGVNEEIRKTEVLKSSFNSINNSINGLVKGAIRWGLAIFSIRGTIGLIRSTMSTLSSENMQIATDIEYMRWILAQTLKPVVEWIINALYIVIGIINMITKALFHYDILAGKSASKFKGMQKSSGGIAKNMAEARKQLAGFDEMNVLDDNTQASGGGGGGVGGGPSIDDWVPPNIDEKLEQFKAKLKEFKDNWFKFGDEMKQSLFNMPFDVWTKAFGKWDLAVYGVTQTVYGLWQLITGFFTFFKGIAEIIYGLITGDTDMIKKGIKDAIDGIKMWIEGIINVIKGVTNIILGVIKGIVITILELISNLINSGISKFESFKSKVVAVWTTIRDGIKQKITDIKNWLTSTFGTIGTKIGNVIGGSISAVVNAILSFAESKINGFINSINVAIKAINKIPGVSIDRIRTVHFPRLAKGGIVNMPGRGVMVGNAIAGERGAEGVIPLTDSQQMALLGEAIGKYITVNASITNTMNGRVISRELKQIQNESDFAYNR